MNTRAKFSAGRRTILTMVLFAVGVFSCLASHAAAQGSASNDPRYNTEINPKYNTNINPTYNTNINPIYNTNISPTHNTNINPKYNTNINPTYNTSINPKYSSEVGVVGSVFSLDGESIGFVVFVNSDTLVLFNGLAEWVGFLSSNGDGGYNWFSIESDWLGYFVYNGERGYNVFDVEGDWIYYMN